MQNSSVHVKFSILQTVFLHWLKRSAMPMLTDCFQHVYVWLWLLCLYFILIAAERWIKLYIQQGTTDHWYNVAITNIILRNNTRQLKTTRAHLMPPPVHVYNGLAFHAGESVLAFKYTRPPCRGVDVGTRQTSGQRDGQRSKVKILYLRCMLCWACLHCRITVSRMCVSSPNVLSAFTYRAYTHHDTIR